MVAVAGRVKVKERRPEDWGNKKGGIKTEAGRKIEEEEAVHS